MQPVSLTAQWTAAIRALETEKTGDRLFVDELARGLAMPDGFELLERYAGGGVREFVTIRTRFFDDTVIRTLEEKRDLRQVVIVAAGMDTRAFRLSWPETTTIFEIDHEALLTEKKSRLLALGKGQSTANRIDVPADLSTEWTDALVTAGFDRTIPTLWVIEGLTFFLTEDQVQSMLRICRGLSSPGSVLVVDMINRTLLKSPASQLFLATLRKDGVPWRFGTDEPEAFLANLGWEAGPVLEPGQVDAAKDRWPYDVYPREIKGAQRSWLVVAKTLDAPAM
jgi:methyltransferase (TIGR00027 family)